MARIRGGGGVQVNGLPELSRALRNVDPALQRELRRMNLDIADFVADDAKAAAYSLGGVAAKVAPSIKANAGSGWAGISLGGSAYPMAGGAEFGAYRYKQFQPWTGNDENAGYFVYPAIRRDADRIETAAGDALDRMIQKAGLSQ